MAMEEQSAVCWVGARKEGMAQPRMKRLTVMRMMTLFMENLL
jgi:hypothetical protein